MRSQCWPQLISCSEVGMTLCIVPICVKDCVFIPPGQSVATAPGRGMTLDKMAFLSRGTWELSAYSFPWGMKLLVLKGEARWLSAAFMTDT